ncbi:MAG TPA: ABC transporter ATP-binding protein [Steroidobacteraceae bacterium]|nr:ABC transporter ATP-binding protein [Steroidobacteraceae bacterium]
MSALLELRDVTVRYRLHGPPRAALTAVDGACLRLDAGEMLGLVGESGCGKSSLGRAILRLVPLSGGEIHWDGRRVDTLGARAFRPLRRELQYVFQDPHACLDPRMTIAQSVAEPLRALMPGLDAGQRAGRVSRLLAEVGLAPELGDRYPHQLSGGQLQRAVIARALVPDPRFVVCDEPVSALDVSVQGQIVNLLADIRRGRGLAGLFISHNLAVVARLCERVMVMYRGRVVETATSAALIAAPLHPYTRELLDAVPAVNPGERERTLRRRVAPAPDDHMEIAAGCAFAARCPFALARCRSERPRLAPAAAGREVACHRAEEWPGGLPPEARF